MYHVKLNLLNCGTLPVFGRSFVKRFALCYRAVVLSLCPVCNVGVLWPNGWMDQDETWHGGRPRPQPHCVTPKGVQHPDFWPMSVVVKRLNWNQVPLSMEVGLGPGYIVLDWDPAPPKKGHSIPHFSAYVYCGQTAGWIKMPIGMEIDLGLDHI